MVGGVFYGVYPMIGFGGVVLLAAGGLTMGALLAGGLYIHIIRGQKMLVEEFIRKMYQGELQRTNSFEVDSEELAGISEEERQKIIGLMEKRLYRAFF